MSNRIAFILIISLPFLSAPAASGADAKDLAKRRIERERQFLYRAAEELNKSQEYVQAAVRSLEKQIDAVDILEPSRRERDISSFLEWYRSYADWLAENLADVEADLSRSYADERRAAVRPERYSTLVDGYSRLGSQLEEQVAHLDKLNDRTMQRIAELRTALDYVSSAAFIEERNKESGQNKEKRQDQPERDRRRERDALYERYKDITDTQVAIMQLDLKNLNELQKHYVVLLEMARMELSWISRKTGDCEALSQLATFVGRDDPDAIEEANNRVIKLYESDITYFKRKVDGISRTRSRIAPSGSLRTLDRLEELSDNYDLMKSRYEHHMTWLAEQTGAYRADIIQIQKQK